MEKQGYSVILYVYNFMLSLPRNIPNGIFSYAYAVPLC